ncbi:hypothetical protein MRX96_037813 [Rhipicephalus microplus]
MPRQRAPVLGAGVDPCRRNRVGRKQACHVASCGVSSWNLSVRLEAWVTAARDPGYTAPSFISSGLNTCRDCGREEAGPAAD